MKAVLIKSFGGPDILKLVDTPPPTLSENQVLVEIHSTSINPFDTYVLGTGAGAKPPLVLGGDFAGVINETSNGVSGFSLGDKVWGQALVHNGGSGSFAEIAVSNVKNTGAMPGNINFDEAASLPLVGASAIQALEDGIKLKSGQKILLQRTQ